MKPKYLMHEAYREIITVALLGILSLAISIHMLVNGDIRDSVVVLLAILVLFLLAVKTFREIEYCLLEESGITFFVGVKKHSFVSWESITKVESREYGFGRTHQERILIYNNEYNMELVSDSDKFEASYARSFCKTLGSDSAFAEYLKYYRADLKIEEV